jgi:hypothetical protein
VPAGRRSCTSQRTRFRVAAGSTVRTSPPQGIRVSHGLRGAAAVAGHDGVTEVDCIGGVATGRSSALLRAPTLLSRDVAVARHRRERALRVAVACGRASVQSALIVGASLGGRVALELAVLEPDRVDGLALIAAALPGHHWQPPSWTSVEKRTQHSTEAMSKQQSSSTCASGSTARPAGGPRSRRLGEIAVPALVVVGDRDALDFVDIARELDARMPNATLRVIRECGPPAVARRPRVHQLTVGRVRRPADSVNNVRSRCSVCSLRRCRSSRSPPTVRLCPHRSELPAFADRTHRCRTAHTVRRRDPHSGPRTRRQEPSRGGNGPRQDLDPGSSMSTHSQAWARWRPPSRRPRQRSEPAGLGSWSSGRLLGETGDPFPRPPTPGHGPGPGSGGRGVGFVPPRKSCQRAMRASCRRGAGGNRTPVHQPVIEPATTIPGIATDAVTPTGRLSARGGPRSVFPVSQRSFSPSAVFPAVIPHFCCRAVMDWPRAAFLLTMVHSQPDESGGEGEAVVFNGSCVCCPV